MRQFLTDAGFPGFPIYADLPVWFDNLSGSIGWASATERDNWFDNVSASLTGITLMPFDRDTFSSIDNGVSWERTNITAAQVRCGIEADIDAGATWPSVPAFNDMMSTMETAYGTSGAVDIQSYRLWREAIAAQPIIWVEAAMAEIHPGWDISFETKPGWHYIITESLNLCSWRQIYLHKSRRHEQVVVPVRNDGDRAFWRVERFEPFQEPSTQR